ncbi:hypothetical protein WS70_04480 [Burkholderia mayonis]|uniref:Uncharacterized protein n=1 Tax=Burkholderia mayonis TaxID=1385591 RepID=A0A1B4FC18_9BURK|nr:hypothetical protein WS70_04480 [Burkholderia mayonis]KVE49488.1 hypothetical protein WS70_20145 [Burkholderia mayonis]
MCIIGLPKRAVPVAALLYACVAQGPKDALLFQWPISFRQMYDQPATWIGTRARRANLSLR